MKKIYCFNNGGSAGMLMAVAIAEDGTCLAQHCCSHEAWMRHDLGIESDWKHEQYDAHYGPGNWKLEWVDDVRAHGGLTEAFRLNQLQGEAAQASE